MAFFEAVYAYLYLIDIKAPEQLLIEQQAVCEKHFSY